MRGLKALTEPPEDYSESGFINDAVVVVFLGVSLTIKGAGPTGQNAAPAIFQ